MLLVFPSQKVTVIVSVMAVEMPATNFVQGACWRFQMYFMGLMNSRQNVILSEENLLAGTRSESYLGDTGFKYPQRTCTPDYALMFTVLLRLFLL